MCEIAKEFLIAVVNEHLYVRKNRSSEEAISVSSYVTEVGIPLLAYSNLALYEFIVAVLLCKFIKIARYSNVKFNVLIRRYLSMHMGDEVPWIFKN